MPSKTRGWSLQRCDPEMVFWPHYKGTLISSFKINPPNPYVRTPCCFGRLTYFLPHSDLTKQKCTQFSWGGCGGVIPFKTKWKCLAARCAKRNCVKDPDPGPCRAAIPKWFYNKTSGVSHPVTELLIDCLIISKLVNHSTDTNPCMWHFLGLRDLHIRRM